MSTGTVKWFNETKGYGFIQPDDGSKDSSCTSPPSSAPECATSSRGRRSPTRSRATVARANSRPATYRPPELLHETPGPTRFTPRSGGRFARGGTTETGASRVGIDSTFHREAARHRAASVASEPTLGHLLPRSTDFSAVSVSPYGRPPTRCVRPRHPTRKVR